MHQSMNLMQCTYEDLVVERLRKDAFARDVAESYDLPLGPMRGWEGYRGCSRACAGCVICPSFTELDYLVAIVPSALCLIMRRSTHRDASFLSS